MINIRVANESDKVIYMNSRIDTFIGEDCFFDISNDILVDEKKKYEEEFEKYLKTTSIITNNGISVGCYSLFSYKDGVLFYIYFVEEYKEKEILSYVIKYIRSTKRGILYTFISKNDYDVYKSNGFIIIAQNDKRYELKNNDN